MSPSDEEIRFHRSVSSFPEIDETVSPPYFAKDKRRVALCYLLFLVGRESRRDEMHDA